MLKIIAIIVISVIIFILVYNSSTDNRFPKAAICSALAAVLAFGGPYIVEYVENMKSPSHTHEVASQEKENMIDATCTDAGSYELVSYCECGEVLSRESFTTEPLGHDYIDSITAPTCDEDGFTSYTCSRCKDTYEDNYTNALGHDFSNGICSQCGYTDPDYQPPDTPDTEKNSNDATYTAKKVNFVTYTGAINNEDQIDSYSLTAPVSGYYRFYMSDMVNGFDVKVYVYDPDGNEIGGSYGIGNNEGVTCELKKKITYTIKVAYYSNTGNYTLNIGQPKKNN